MALSPQWLDELRARITLSTVIMRTTKLQRAGREWKACCPFHNEKSPSFTVNDQKGFYHCFGCGAHGDVIRWMTDQRGLQFMDAVKELAVEAGMEVPAPDPRAAQRAEERASLTDVMHAAQQWYVASLQGPDGAKARDYLATRGFEPRTVETFGFGYAPDARQALPEALSGFEEAMLVEAGMRIETEKGDRYDRFRDRLMLPIQDARGRIIAFGGRILDKRDGVAKYLNSPDTPLFDKGRTLYNLHRAAPASRQTGRMIAVEGYMDVIALANAGFEDAVAPLGTALTEQQIELLWRHVDKPVLCFDGDAAGQRAAMRAITRALPLLRPGKSLQIVQLPAGLDPDDLIRQRGAKALEALLADPLSMLEIVWSHERDAHPLASPEDKAGLKARLMAHVDTIEDRDIAALYRRDLLDRFSAFAFPRRERNFQPRQGQRARPAPMAPQVAERLRRAVSGTFRDMLSQAVLAGFARHPGEIARHSEKLLRLAAREPRLAPVIDELIEISEMLEHSGDLPISSIGNLPPPPDKARFSFLVEGSDPGDAREDLAEALALLVERPAIEAAIAAATARFDSDPEGAFAEQQRLRKRKLEIESRLGHMARKRAASAALGSMKPETAEAGDTGRQETD